jgi:hypothetical protein
LKIAEHFLSGVDIESQALSNIADGGATSTPNLLPLSQMKTTDHGASIAGDCTAEYPHVPGLSLCGIRRKSQNRTQCHGSIGDNARIWMEDS